MQCAEVDAGIERCLRHSPGSRDALGLGTEDRYTSNKNSEVRTVREVKENHNPDAYDPASEIIPYKI